MNGGHYPLYSVSVSLIICLCTPVQIYLQLPYRGSQRAIAEFCLSVTAGPGIPNLYWVLRFKDRIWSLLQQNYVLFSRAPPASCRWALWRFGCHQPHSIHLEGSSIGLTAQHLTSLCGPPYSSSVLKSLLINSCCWNPGSALQGGGCFKPWLWFSELLHFFPLNLNFLLFFLYLTRIHFCCS